jgi:glycosyltransferase involved in cell wall biosynthesis
MHVCYIFHREYPQNNATDSNEYTKILAEKEVEVTVISARTDSSQSEHEVVHGVEVHRILTDTLGSASLGPTKFALQAFRLLDEICRAKEVDILHMYAFPNLGFVLRPLPWWESPSAVVTDIRGAAVGNRLRNILSRSVLRVQHQISQHTVTISPIMAEDLLGTDAVDILPLGADFDRFAPGENSELRESWGFTDEDIIFGYVGSVNGTRELKSLVDATINANQQHSQIKSVVVGGGNEEQYLKEYAKRSGNQDTVHIAGEKPFSEIPDYIRAFDVGVSYIPDKRPYRIQPPIKTVEYLASGLPVLATDTPGNQRFIEHESNGILVPHKIADYSREMVRLSNDGDLRKRIASSARQSVRDYNYWNIVDNDLIPLYQRIIAE